MPEEEKYGSPDFIAAHFKKARGPEEGRKLEHGEKEERVDFLPVQQGIEKVGSAVAHLNRLADHATPEQVNKAIKDFPDEALTGLLQTLREQTRRTHDWLEDAARPPNLLRNLRELYRALNPADHPAVNDLYKADELRAEIQRTLNTIE